MYFFNDSKDSAPNLNWYIKGAVITKYKKGVEPFTFKIRNQEKEILLVAEDEK